MELLIEILKFLVYITLIVVISKYVLVKTLRSLAKNLNLKPKTVGNIAGIATSVPELLTISASSYGGLLNASIYNVLSSNVINLIQYYTAIALNKNQKILQNKAIKVELFLVILTIILPVFFVLLKSELQIAMVPVFILLYFGFNKISGNVHKLYLSSNEKEEVDEKENNAGEKNRKGLIKNVIVLFITGILLFVVGNLLSDTLEELCLKFKIPQLIIGIILGFVTSIPELITFFESQRHHSKEQNDVHGVVEATNNLITSNMMNLFIIQSIGVVIFAIFHG